MAMTRAELMRHALSQALRRVQIGAKKLKINEARTRRATSAKSDQVF